MQEDEIIGFDALYTSMGKCSKGVRRKAAVGRYCLFGMDEILRLQSGTCHRHIQGTANIKSQNHLSKAPRGGGYQFPG